MHKTQFKSLTWSNNPDKVRITHQREPIFFVNESGEVFHMGFGPDYCYIYVSGAFAGPTAYASIAKLEALYKDTTSGQLYLPDGTSYQVYLMEFNHSQNLREAYAAYELTFRLTDSTGALYEYHL